jgi:RNA polymerase sigma-70 factor (ECF subfamily)
VNTADTLETGHGAAGRADGDGKLLELLADDLDAGFAELVRTYETTLYSVALRACGQRTDAEDLAAEAFLKAYTALRGYDGQRLAALRPRPWLVTIQLNVWRNWVRTRTRRPAQIPSGQPPAGGTAEPAGSGPEVEEQAELAETSRELADLLNHLPQVQRTAVVLRHVVGMSVAEVAEVIGCPDGTAKSHVSRGLRRLRELSAPEGSQEGGGAR